MHRKIFQYAWLGVLAISATLACNLVSTLQEARQLRETARIVETLAQDVATQAQELATSISESGALATAQAFATEEGSSILATGEALLTEAARSGALETAQARLTEEGGEFLATVQAVATQGFTFSNPPEDVSIPQEPEVENLYATQDIVSYTIGQDFAAVLDFYKREMPANGWTAVSEGTLESEQAAVLKYTKDGRSATLSLSEGPQEGQTVVVITLVNP